MKKKQGWAINKQENEMLVDKKPKMPSPVQRKTLGAALGHFLGESVPALNSPLLCDAVVEQIEKLIDKYLPRNERLRPGQVLWYPVDANDKGHYGKLIEDTAIKPVIMDLITEQDIDDYVKKTKTKRERQKAVAVRLHQQCYKQGGVMTYADTAAIMRLSTSTIGTYIREHEKLTGDIIPRRGNIHDMGPTLTHKKIICIKHLKEGKNIQTTALETNHSPEAVTRYVRDFKRVYLCLKESWSLEKIAQATGLSKPLVDEYTNLINEEEDISNFDNLPF